MNEPPHVTIAVINWNGKSLLQTCLETLSINTDYPSYRVVVVDNGSTDGSVQMISKKFPHIHLIENDTNRGFAKANNQVFEQFPKTDYYLLLNNDTEIIQSGWLENLVNGAEESEAGIAGCKILNPDHSLQHGGTTISPGWPPALTMNEDTRGQFENDENERWKPDAVIGAAFLVKRETIVGTGGFDEDYSPAFFEEFDLCVRAKNKGHNVVYIPDTTILHKGRASVNSTPEFYFENMFRFYFLHFPLSWLAMQLFFELRAVLGHIYHNRSLRKIYHPIISSLPQLLRERKRVGTREVLEQDRKTYL